ncbi:MAG: hypothetical protein J5842_02875 [Lachnospiraceae bacterium]|nr:hypothetical protein [Lachnospiraceae bacterium]
MRAIGSAMILANRRGEELLVYWKVAPELGCPFEQLFEKSTAFKLKNYRSDYYPPKVLAQLTGFRVDNEAIRSNRTEEGLNDAYVSSLPGKVYIATEEHFFKNRDYSAFVPRKDLMKRVDELTQPCKDRLVGVHIRRTDNKPAIGKSSTDAFIKAMEKELTQNSDTMFYIATDDLKEEMLLRDRFKGHIISNEGRDLSRDSITGIRDALIDLYSLASSTKIIGSYFSSFTDLASDIRGIPLTIASSDD